MSNSTKPHSETTRQQGQSKVECNHTTLYVIVNTVPSRIWSSKMFTGSCLSMRWLRLFSRSYIYSIRTGVRTTNSLRRRLALCTAHGCERSTTPGRLQHAETPPSSFPHSLLCGCRALGVRDLGKDGEECQRRNSVPPRGVHLARARCRSRRGCRKGR